MCVPACACVCVYVVCVSVCICVYMSMSVLCVCLCLCMCVATYTVVCAWVMQVCNVMCAFRGSDGDTMSVQKSNPWTHNTCTESSVHKLK